MAKGPILVGVDGSPASQTALEWAAREAYLRDTGLHIVHAFPWPLVGVPIDPRRTSAWDDAQRLVADARRTAEEWVAAERLRTEVATDGPSAALIQRSAEADLVVLGTRGRGGFRELLIGSVALQVAGHASCHVVLVHAGWRPPVHDREIAVGVDGDAALAAAFAEAELRGVMLRAVRAWQPLVAFGPGGFTPMVTTVAQIERHEESHLVRSLMPWRTRYPRVKVVESLVCDGARHALGEASTRAELLVIGARDHFGGRALALGSTAHAVVHHAKCPVLVARDANV